MDLTDDEISLIQPLPMVLQQVFCNLVNQVKVHFLVVGFFVMCTSVIIDHDCYGNDWKAVQRKLPMITVLAGTRAV